MVRDPSAQSARGSPACPRIARLDQHKRIRFGASVLELRTWVREGDSERGGQPQAATLLSAATNLFRRPRDRSVARASASGDPQEQSRSGADQRTHRSQPMLNRRRVVADDVGRPRVA